MIFRLCVPLVLAWSYGACLLLPPASAAGDLHSPTAPNFLCCSDNLDLTKPDIGGASIAAVTGAVFSRILLGAGACWVHFHTARCRLQHVPDTRLLWPPSSWATPTQLLPCARWVFPC